MILVFGGAGFVGLNIVEELLRRGRPVAIFDRAPPPAAARETFARYSGALTIIEGDVRDEAQVQAAITPGVDAVVFGTAITADAARDASEPAAVLETNLMSLIPILLRAKAVGVRRVVNLSSAVVYGRAGKGRSLLCESGPADPVGLYGISKLATESVGRRLGDLLALDVRSVRLSAAFGPWERPTGVRDTMSPLGQIMAAALRGEPALLARPGPRDWLYAPDAAQAVVAILDAPHLAHDLYNISGGDPFTALAWGQALATYRLGFVCRLADAGETATIDLHGPTDRPPLDSARMAVDLGWRARYGLEESLAHWLEAAT